MQPASATESKQGKRRKEHTLCRACHLSCSLIVEFEGSRPVRISGDKNNPISHGFSCIRGRELAHCGELPSRLNWSWLEHTPLLRKWRYNPAFMHPGDLHALGLQAGDTIRIRSERSSIRAVVQAEEEIKKGCISMSHGWGVNPDEPEDPSRFGGTTSRLSGNVTHCDPISWIPVMSVIPVSIERQ